MAHDKGNVWNDVTPISVGGYLTAPLHYRAMESARHAVIAKMPKKSAHVNDLLTGAASEGEAKRLYKEADLIFVKASMTLHKWGSNSPVLREMFEEDGTDERSLRQVAGVLEVL